VSLRLEWVLKMLVVETLGAVAGIGVFLVGVLGAATMRSNLWKSPFAMFAVAGLLLSSNSLINIFHTLGMVPGALVPLETAMMVSFILLVMGISSILLVLARIYGNSTFSTILLPRDALTRMTQRLEKMYGKAGAKHIMYGLGKDSEYHVALEMKRRLGMDGESLVKWLPDIFSLLGWAEKTKVIEYVPKETILLRTTNNFEALNAPCDGTVSCNFLSGSIAGLTKAVHPGRDCEVVETKCQSLGDDYCEFTANLFPLPRWGLVRSK